MTDLSPRNAYPTGWRTDAGFGPHAAERLLIRKIWLARATLAIERLAPAALPVIGLLGIYLTAAFFGLFTVMPWTVQALILAATITAMGLVLDAGLKDFSWPTVMDGERRLERDSGLAHRPISERGDRMIGHDPMSELLWRRHQARTLPLNRLAVAWPDAHLERRDPKNLRLFLLIALTAGWIAAGHDWRARLAGAFDSGAGATLDAWADPPPYTGMAPVYLAAGDKSLIAIPTGSVLNLRAHGAIRPPGVSLGGNRAPRFLGSGGEYAGQAKLTQDAHVRVRAAGHRIGNWNVHVIPDHVPVIAFTAKPVATERDAVKFAFRASDDYGVTRAQVVIRPHDKGGAPLVAELPVSGNAKKLAQTNYLDLTAHPYAGLMVDARLEARDGAGQVGVSTIMTFQLPARVFTDPLARALIEQRQNLATSASRDELRKVARALAAFTIAPDRFYANKLGVYTALRAALWGVRVAQRPSDVTRIEQLLWDIAIAVEQNGLLTAANNLRALQALITQAMAAHAPQEVIDRLLERYNQVMKDYMAAMAANAPPGTDEKQGNNSNSRELHAPDLQAMMKAIQQLSAAGDREGAARMLAMLQEMLENLKVTKSAGSGQGAGDKQMNEAIQKFGDLMGKQRALMDQTMRQRQQQQQGGGGKGAEDLSRAQGALRNELSEAMRKMGAGAGKELGKAGQEMENAMKALGQKDLSKAGQAQQNALEQLRAGADALAKQQQAGQGTDTGGNHDPLGRGRAGFGDGVKIPDASDMARARDILQELRRRSGERGRPQQELDYLDRLLKEF